MVQRLDVLLYAHDGRGLGHVSRSVAIGLALRRLYPRLKVLFVSGCSFTQELIGRAPLDWLKLPAYKTIVSEGKSRGVAGHSMFEDSEIGRLRTKDLAHFVSVYRPRLVLVDHTPQGKHRELVDALVQSSGRQESEKTRWILGVRGVVGSVPQANSTLAGDLFHKHYGDLLWYGDSGVLGPELSLRLEQQYGVRPVECGYVLRLAEFCHYNHCTDGRSKVYAGTISLPWLGEHSHRFVSCLAQAIKSIGPGVGEWRLFIDMGVNGQLGEEMAASFAGIANCRIEPPSAHYVPSLLHSKSALVFGGYNSLMDVLYAGVPALVVLREMEDAEQQIHLEKLRGISGTRLSVVMEPEVTVALLVKLLLANLSENSIPRHPVNVDGATNAANYLYSLIP